MRVFRTLLGYIGTVEDEPVKQAASAPPPPDNVKEEPRATWMGTAPPIGPAPTQPRITSTAPPPSMADALKKGNKR